MPDDWVGACGNGPPLLHPLCNAARVHVLQWVVASGEALLLAVRRNPQAARAQPASSALGVHSQHAAKALSRCAML